MPRVVSNNSFVIKAIVPPISPPARHRHGPTNPGAPHHINPRPRSGCGFVDGASRPRPQLHRSATTAKQVTGAFLNPLKIKRGTILDYYNSGIIA